FYDSSYSTVYVSSEGFLQFGTTSSAGDPNNSTTSLQSRIRIAPLWDNLKTNGTGDDVFVDTSVANRVTIRWNATNVVNSSDVNVAVTLFGPGSSQPGVIRFDYGSGNTNPTPTIGISRGDSHTYLLATYDGQAALTNANSVLFQPAPTSVDLGTYEF